MNDESAIRELVNRYIASIEAKDAAAATACYTSDVVAYDLAPPLEMGPTEVRNPANIQEWFDTWEGPIKSEARNLTVKVGGNVAYAFSLHHMTGKKRDGESADLWFRATAAFLKDNGEWKISHIHNSVPFAMDGTGKALGNLKP